MEADLTEREPAELSDSVAGSDPDGVGISSGRGTRSGILSPVCEEACAF